MSLHMSQVTLTARAYLSFCSTKLLTVFLLRPGLDASPSDGYPLALNLLVSIYTPGKREK